MIDFSTATARQVIEDAEAFAATKRRRNRESGINQYDYFVGVLEAQIGALVAERDRLQRLLWPTPGATLDDGDADLGVRGVMLA